MSAQDVPDDADVIELQDTEAPDISLDDSDTDPEPHDSPTESRRQQRLHRIEALFSWSFFDGQNWPELSEEGKEQFLPAQPIIEIRHQLDERILQYATKHTIENFNKIDLAILRQALYELLYTDTPPAVVIDEAVEISKLYGSEETPSFVHGVLGNIVDDMRKDAANEPDTQQ